MAISEKDDTSWQVKSIPPKFAEKMRRRRPGYDQVYKLLQEYDEIPPDQRAQMSEFDLSESYVQTMFQALGWSIVQTAPGELPEVDFILAYRDLRMPVEVKEFSASLGSQADDWIIRLARSMDSPWGILTNFETIRVWGFRDPDYPTVVLETSPWSYIADDREEDDLLAAEIFYQRLVQPASDQIEVSDVESARVLETTTAADQASAGLAVRTCRVGVHGRNDYWQCRFEESDYELIREARIEQVKMMISDQASNPEVLKNAVGVYQRLREINPDMDFVVRLFDAEVGDGRHPTPQEFANRFTPIMNPLHDECPYVVKFEILSEPNHMGGLGGWGPEADQARDFSRWFLETYELLKAACPWASLGFPALAIPQGPEPGLDLDWIEICRDAVERSDWLGVHCYWQNPTDKERNHLADFWGLRFKAYHQKFPDKVIEITEFANSNGQSGYPVDLDKIAQEYVEYYQELFKYPYINSAASFIMSSPDPTWGDQGLTWRKESGEFWPVVYAVRDMPRLPFGPAAVYPDLGRYAETDGPRQRFEEVIAGLSFGGGDAPARTLTALATDRASGRPLLLLAGGTLPPGTQVIQPAPQHGGGRQDRIGIVEREVFNERCLAAVARLEGERPFLSMLPDGQIVAGVAEPTLDLQVGKFGGGSGYTQSQVIQINVNIELTDDYQRKIVLRDGMFIAGPGFSQPGDVGALVLTTDTHQAVGVIVGYSDDGRVTSCLPIQSVLDELEVDLVTRPVRYKSTQQPTDRIAAATDLIDVEDRLGFTHYVKAFVRLIQDTQPPLTIGIYGAWGTGKSFLMDKIAKRLKPEGDVKQVEKLTLWQKMFRLAKTQMPVVWFDAWDYNACDKLWAGLVERIFLSIENSGLGWYGQLRINLKRNLERQWRALRAKLLPYTLMAIVVAALTLGFVLTNQDAWATAVGGSTAFVLLASLVRQLAGVFRTSASQRIVDLFATPDYEADIGFMGRIRQDLEDFANSLPEGMKVVVFIDDLDRCDPKKSVEVLEAIKLLLDFKRFIVFLALDARVITQAIEEHYGQVLTEAEITGYEYLDKIVQIPFSIPEPPLSELRKYIGSLVGLSEADIPPIETMAVRQEEKKEERQQPEFVEEPMTPEPTMPPSPITGAPSARQAEQVPSTAQPPAPVSPPKPSDEGQVIEDMLDTSVVTFTRPEQQAILAFYSHLDPNPRRIKRVVNIYRLVRALIASQQQTQEAGRAAALSSLLENSPHVLGWLILCEQWPYAAHVMLEEFDRSQSQIESDSEPLSTLVQLHRVAQQRITQEGDEALKKLDLKYDRLQSFVETHLHDLTLTDLQRLRPYTVNFNPALSAEVRLTLSKAGF